MSRQLAYAGIVGFCVVWACPAHAGDDDLPLDLGGSVTIELRRIPKGTFVQGSPANEPGREPDEIQRNVTISKSFWLAKTPVTRAQFARFVSDTRHVTDAEKAQHAWTWRNPGFLQKEDDPAIVITYGDANAFVAWASRKSGRRVRLPTEAEWEYAARAGTTTPWFGATKEDEAIAAGWFKANASNMTHPVTSKKPNAFGLFDMSGNVYQWCRDVYAPYPAGDATDPESTTPTAGDERRVVRGGSFNKDPKRGRSAARHKLGPGVKSAEVGFRVAADDNGPPASQIIPPPTEPTTASSAAGGAATPTDADASASALSFAPTSSPARSEGIPWLLIAAPFVGAALAVGWKLLRRRRYPPGTFGITTRAQPNGFWIRSEGLPVGTEVELTCIVAGEEIIDRVTLEGEATFVRTGHPPTAIRILELRAPDEARPPSARVVSGGRPRTGVSVAPSSAHMPSASPFHPPSAPVRPSVRFGPGPTDPTSVTGPSLPAAAPVAPPPPPPPAHRLSANPPSGSHSVSGPPSGPRHAIVDQRESANPFLAARPPLLAPEAFVVATPPAAAAPETIEPEAIEEAGDIVATAKLEPIKLELPKLKPKPDSPKPAAIGPVTPPAAPQPTPPAPPPAPASGPALPPSSSSPSPSRPPPAPQAIPPKAPSPPRVMPAEPKKE